jgi:hypothetical protein
MLICGISLFAGDKAARASIDGNYHVTKPRISRLSVPLPSSPQCEGVTVLNLTEDINSPGASYQTYRLGFRQPAFYFSYDKKLPGWSYNHVRKRLCGNRMWHFGQWVRQNLTPNPLRYAVRRGLAAIAGTEWDSNQRLQRENGFIPFSDFSKDVRSQLPVRRADHDNEYKCLEEGSDHSSAGEDEGPPICRRLGLAIGCIGGGLILAANAPDDERICLSTACIGGGLTLIAAGLSLWWATGLPATWGWLL